MYPIGKYEKIEDKIHYQSLYGHTYDCLKILFHYVNVNFDVIEDFCKNWNLNLEFFLKNLFLFIYFHDVGKIILEFQNNIKKGKTSNNYPHALYSFYLLRDLKYESNLSLEYELLSVLGHHTQLYSSIYDDQKNIPTFLENEIIMFIDLIYDTFINLGFNNYFELNKLKFNLNFTFNSIKFKRYRNNLITKSAQYNNKFLLKSIFTFFFSILQLCDDYASYNFHNFVKNKQIFNEKVSGSVLNNPENYSWRLDEDFYLKKLFIKYKPYEFQKILINNPEINTLLFAPCGRGKTEAAIGWALSSLKKFNKNKIIFAMPTQVTSNAMWDRLSKIFGFDNVGLYHGKSFIKLNDSLNFKNLSDIHSEVFKGNVFFKPITITTIDHLIYSFVHGFSQADFALGNLQTSVIVFDEVHYYDKKTLNHLYTLYSFLREMNIPHILMSGTLPKFIINSLDSYKKIIDFEGLNFQPFLIEYSSEVLIKTKENHFISKKLIKEIIKNYNDGLKQFFIFNTIDRAKQFYFKLKNKYNNLNLILYHSQFTHNDRVKKENEIIQKSLENSSFILIATQIIEISLDITSDIMYTELAPPDALGQRGGRLNRKKEVGEFKMKIFEAENYHPYDSDLIEKTRKNMKLGKVSYLSFKEWCDNVYSNKKLEKSNLLNFFNASVLFGNHPKDIAFSEEQGNKLELRDSSFQKVDVIPIEVYNYDINNLTIENQVKIPLWWIKKDEEENIGNAKIFFNEIQGNNQFIISRMKYTYELGFDKNHIIELDDFNDWYS